MGEQPEYLHLAPFPKQNTYNFSADRLYLCDWIYSSALLYKTLACNFKIFEAMNVTFPFTCPSVILQYLMLNIMLQLSCNALILTLVTDERILKHSKDNFINNEDLLIQKSYWSLQTNSTFYDAAVLNDVFRIHSSQCSRELHNQSHVLTSVKCNVWKCVFWLSKSNP